MQIVRGTITEYLEQLKPMFKEHWEEVGMAGSEDLKLDIDVNHYEHIERNGQYLAMALLSDTGDLAGYLSIFVYGHPHHVYCNFGAVDCFMIRKQYRNYSGFKSIIKMFKMAEEILKKEFNVTYLQFCFSVNNNLEALARRMGYVPSDMLYLKKLKKEGN